MLVVLQGRDSAGKDGAIKNVVGNLNPRGVNVVSFGVPTAEEREHDFLWRVHRHAPRLGEFAIFNRSHYEDVLVVRVHDLAPEEALEGALRAHRRLRGAARRARHHRPQVLPAHHREGAEGAPARAREGPATAWKLNPTDWNEREYWDEYTEAYEDAISKTAAAHAPWTVVPADAKWYRNLVVAETIVEALRPTRRNSGRSSTRWARGQGRARALPPVGARGAGRQKKRAR